MTSARQAFVAYTGPTLAADAAYRWTVEARGPGARWGPASAPARFTTALRDGDWQAQWLRPAGDSQQPDRVTYLRTEVTPPAGAIDRVTAYVSAAHTYRLFVDGAPVDAWPSFSYPDEQYVRAVDLTGAVAGGRRSAIGVLHRWYGPGQGRPASSPGLLFQLSVWYRDGRRVVFGSDGTWRERPAEWLPSPQRNSDVGDFVEWVDGREQPQGWSSPGYDDGAWSPVTVVGPAGTAPFSRTYAQRTTITETPVHPVRLHTVAGGAVVADFGAVYAARPRVAFSRGQSGRTVALRAGYLLDPDGQVSTLHGTQETNLSSSYIMREGSQAFEAFTYFGFRYLQIDDPGEPLGPDAVVALTRHAAMPDVPNATFSSDNRTLNAVWRLNARSCLYCSNEQFVDTPTREKGQFVWDAANESEGVMRAYGDQNMSWQGLRDVARGQARYWPDGRVNAVYPNGDGARDYATFTARYPEWVWRYYTSTGDRTTALRLYPSVAQVADWLWGARQAGTGLLYGLGDTSNGDPVYGYDLSVAADTASNVLAVERVQPGGAAGHHGRGQRRRAEQPGAGGPADRGGQRRAAAARRSVRGRGRRRRRAEHERVAGGQRPAARLRRRAGARPRRRRRLRGEPRHRRGAQPRPRAPARAGGGGPARGRGAHAHRRLHPGVGPDPGQGRDLHLGGVEAERPDRGLHVARVGLLRARRHAGDAPGGDPGGARRRRHRPGGRHAALGRPGARRGLGADRRGSPRHLVAAKGRRHGAGPDRAGQRVGRGAPSGERAVERARRRRPGGARLRRHRRLGGRRDRRPGGGERELPLHQRMRAQAGTSYEVQVVPGGGVTPLTRYVCTSSRTQALEKYATWPSPSRVSSTPWSSSLDTLTAQA